MKLAMQGLAALLLLWSPSVLQAQQRPVMPADCLDIRYMDEVSLTSPLAASQDGKKLLYAVKAPASSADPDLRQLFMKEIHVPGGSREVVSGDLISQVTWLPDDHHALMLMRRESATQIVIVDLDTGHIDDVTKVPRGVIEYTVSRDGTKIVFTTPNLILGKSTGEDVSKERDAALLADSSGYRVSVNQPAQAGQRLENLLYRTELVLGTGWSTPEPVVFSDPYTGKENQKGAVGLAWLSLSPDGTNLLFNYPTDHFPRAIVESPIRRGGMGATVLYDFKRGKTSLPIPTDDGVYSIPVWSNDGKSFIAVANPPVGSRWEARNIAEHLTSGGDVDMYWVEPATQKIQEVYHHVHNDHEGPLGWFENGEVAIQTSDRTISYFRPDGATWKKTKSFDIPEPEIYRYSISQPIMADENTVVGIYETPATPPDVFSYDSSMHQLTTETKLNPQLDQLTLANVELVHWKNSTGYEFSGFLFLPVGYRPGQRYPLVIQTKGDQGWFLCDGGARPAPSFQPQPLASAGIMYLVRYRDATWKQADEIANYPKNYPGQLGEVGFEMEQWESAISMLGQRGLVDTSKVGLMGFSRTGWMIEFMLAHSKVNFAVASAMDNVQYSLGEYWLKSTEGSRKQYDAMYGGPPYGASLKNWLDYSVSFNLDRIHTPLLLELNGYGVHDNVPGMMPVTMGMQSEILTGLTRLGKPVDFYYYPTANHRMDQGKTHAAELNRVYDWFRFWLQGYEDQDSVKREQYELWERFGKLASTAEVTSK